MNNLRPNILSVLLVLLIGTLFYQAELDTRSELITSCERVNVLRLQVSGRSVPIRRTIQLLIDTRTDEGAVGPSPASVREIAKLRRYKEQVKPVQEEDCEERFSRPWPLD